METVDEYLGALPGDVRERMAELRVLVHRELPEAGERISYGMPTFTAAGRPVVHLAAWRHHIALYPLPELPAGLADRVAPWRGTKDAMRLPHDRPLPSDLVAEVVRVLLAAHAA
ncbi:iron chaperone [Blastococcus sp. VKM Ac-2987]|uniref:iron chaperone n=1 Tax=Blastococcus sp. VKM Ac-2987 TaxID=3004141 RepID=UPI0022AB6E0F|nr:DUF1801 domain-containing protein [Blastococcus sp. VKM Ac-2987]MCZ2858706.1 DUF1801 domain-containing protein [Blastococcus sp. VKM Ac-2987]